MRLLVLGGTAWLGSTVARRALDHGHEVVCLARGESGPVPVGVELVRGDRSSADGYAPLRGDFDALVDVARDPHLVRTATEALRDRVGHWVFVSTMNVYVEESTPGADESAPLRDPMPEGEWSPELYGEGKVACEQHLLATLGAGRVTIARAGLLAGPGDPTGRTGYWPLRFAHPAGDGGAVLVPDEPGLMTQQLDVRDLAAWLVDSAERARPAVVNTAGEPLPWSDYLALVREITHHTGPVVPRSADWLAAHDVQPWMGARSLPLWLPMPDYAGFSTRDTSRAVSLGLARRPVRETLGDVLAWELRAGPGRPRGAGLSADDERALLAAD